MDRFIRTSVHGQAGQKGNEKAPGCSSSHNAHNVESTTLTANLKDGCLKCHKDAGKLHSKWLSNPPIALPSFAKAHFDVVSCATCHAKSAEPAIYLSLYNRWTGKPLSEEEVAKSLGTDTARFMAKIDENADGRIEAREMWNLFAALFGKGITTTFMGKMDVRNATEAHMIGGKADAVKDSKSAILRMRSFFRMSSLPLKRQTEKRPLIKLIKKCSLRSTAFCRSVNFMRSAA